jgi:type II secretory pathway pseudopilin PulG
MKRQRGDTIIEVLFATTIFSMIAVSSLSIMNQGTAMAQRALEIGLVRQQIDAQADALRYLNQAYIADFGRGGPATALWNSVVLANAVTEAVPFDSMVVNNKCVQPISAQKPFALNIKKIDTNPLLVSTATPATYAQVRYDTPIVTAEGIWIQAVRSPVVPGKTGFYDFHIRACWDTPGQPRPVTIGTIVRLYEPRG